MARYKLENELITIKVDEHGAELKSLVRKDNETEYMWSADPTYWGRTSCPLSVCRCSKGRYLSHKGKKLQHGSARLCP